MSGPVSSMAWEDVWRRIEASRLVVELKEKLRCLIDFAVEIKSLQQAHVESPENTNNPWRYFGSCSFSTELKRVKHTGPWASAARGRLAADPASATPTFRLSLSADMPGSLPRNIQRRGT